MRELTPEEILYLSGRDGKGIEYPTECTECGEPLDSVEIEDGERTCFACALLRED